MKGAKQEKLPPLEVKTMVRLTREDDLAQKQLQMELRLRSKSELIRQLLEPGNNTLRRRYDEIRAKLRGKK